MKKIAVFAAAIFTALVLGISACHDETGEVFVGVVVPLTGSLEPTGLSMRNGFELAAGEINGSALLGDRKIRLVVEDSESTSDGAVAAYDRLIEQRGVPVVMGPFTSSATEKIIPLVEKGKVVSIGPTSAAKGLSARSGFLFRTTLNVGRLVPEGVKIVKDLRGYSNVAAIVNEADTFSMSSHDELKKAFGKNGMTLVSEQSFSRSGNEELPDLTTQLTAVKDAPSPAPEALFVSALPQGRAGVIVQARKLGIDIPIVATLLTANEVKEANKRLSGSAEGAVSFTSWSRTVDTRGNKDFIDNYRAENNEEPGAFAARSYVSVYILTEALSKASSTDSEAIRAELAEIKDLDTLLGGFSFDENGDAVYDPVVVVVKNGEFEVFK